MTVNPGAVCGYETWPMTEVDIKRLNTWEGKILRGNMD